jgi:hypothetical protein
MGTALVGHVHRPDAVRNANRNPDARRGRCQGKGGKPEGYRTGRLYHRTVLAIPSSPETGGTNPSSSLIFAELTRNEGDSGNLPRSPQFAPVGGKGKSGFLSQFAADRGNHARGVRSSFTIYVSCASPEVGLNTVHRRHHVPTYTMLQVWLDQETAAAIRPSDHPGKVPLFPARRRGSEKSPRHPVPLASAGPSSDSSLLIPYGVEGWQGAVSSRIPPVHSPIALIELTWTNRPTPRSLAAWTTLRVPSTLTRRYSNRGSIAVSRGT